MDFQEYSQPQIVWCLGLGEGEIGMVLIGEESNHQ